MTECVRCERKVQTDRMFFTKIARSAVVCSECADGSHNGPVAELAHPESESA